MADEQQELNSIAKLHKAIDKSLAHAAKVLSTQKAQSHIDKNDFHLMVIAKTPSSLTTLQSELRRMDPKKIDVLLKDQNFLASISDLSYTKQKEKIENELDDINKQLGSGKSNATPTTTPGSASPTDLSSDDEDWDKDLNIDSDMNMSIDGSQTRSREEASSFDDIDWGEDEDMRPDLSLEETTALQARAERIESQLSQEFPHEKTLLSQVFNHLRVLNKSLAQVSPEAPAPSHSKSRVKAMVNEYENRVQDIKGRVQGNQSIPKTDVDKRNNKP